MSTPPVSSTLPFFGRSVQPSVLPPPVLQHAFHSQLEPSLDAAVPSLWQFFRPQVCIAATWVGALPARVVEADEIFAAGQAAKAFRPERLRWCRAC